MSLLRITRVRDWSICFDYGDKHYLLHGQSEIGEGSGQDLYERTLDKNGKYELKHIKSKWFVNENVAWDYIQCNYNKQNNSIVYSQIDKEFFAYKLTKRGFATGIMEQRVKVEEDKIKSVEVQIREYEDRIRELRQSISKLK
ncbi:hypothetical protein [Enterocloster bolteae]|uniref:hypothetical protein n=1 Tax=Enterocloster bolteae TaxID=208479 RepID=UPI002A80DA4C|nr:hypothetical protein [Enterocloster bolteae]